MSNALAASVSPSALRAASRRPLAALSLLALLALGLGVAFPGHALDLVGFVGFVVALISLSALRNFGPVLFYVGLAIFAAVGLVIAGAIMGAVI